MANCNKQQLNITCGTDVVLHDTLIFDGEPFDPALSVGITANLVSSLGKRTALEVEVADGGLIIYVPWVERNAGYYGLEVTGSCNSKKWATYADSLIHYTRSTEMGVAEVTIESDYYDITQVVGYRYSTSPISKVTATIDDEVGDPEVEVAYNNLKLSFAFHNLKGQPMVYEDLTPEQKAELTGPKGDQGDSAVFDPDTGNILATLHNTIGYDDANAMTQKAVTEELDKFTAESVTGFTWHNKAINSSGYVNDNKTNKCSDELTFDTTKIGRVRVALPNNHTKFAIYAIAVVEGVTTYTNITDGYTGAVEGFLIYPNWQEFVPVAGTKYVIRQSPYPTVSQAARDALTSADIALVTQYYKSSTHAIDDHETRIEAIEADMSTENDIPTYKWGKISSSGYSNNGSTETNKITQEYLFDPSEVTEVTAKLPDNSGLKFAIYTITGTTYSALSGGWVTEDYTFTPVSGTKYVIRISPNTSPVTREDMLDIDPSLYPYFVVKYATAKRLDDIDERVHVLEQKCYGFLRTYANITSLLTFENKAISAQGIEDSQTALLAKIPSIGCVEVKMNKPVGGFSIWKKLGNTIICLQEYTHYQYRYTGDYESEYYVMLQAETGETLTTAIATVYTYSDMGKTYAYTPPTWAAGKKVAFLGDSIVQGRYPKNGSPSVNICMDKPWPNLVAETLGAEDYTDFAIGGATVYNSDWKSLQRNASLITGYDVVFVCGGTNDYGDKVSKANFEAAYSDMLDTLIAHNTKVIAMTPVYRTKTVSSPAMGLSGYADSITDIATAKEVDVIPMLTLTNTGDFYLYLVDGLHPNETGQRMIADIVLEEINKL